MGAGVVTLLLVWGLIDIATFFIVRARVQTAADAAALAAASELIPGIGRNPEAQARRFASANGAQLVQCSCTMGSRAAQVLVRAPVRYFLAFNGATTEVAARARAGIDLDAIEASDGF